MLKHCTVLLEPDTADSRFWEKHLRQTSYCSGHVLPGTCASLKTTLLSKDSPILLRGSSRTWICLLCTGCGHSVPSVVCKMNVHNYLKRLLKFPSLNLWSGESPGDLPNPGVKPDLPHCSQILYRLSHQGSLWLALEGSWSVALVVFLLHIGTLKFHLNFIAVILLEHNFELVQIFL